VNHIPVHSIPLGLSQAYLIEGEAGPVLVDAGMPGQERAIMRRLRALGRDDLRLIFITHAHPDHDGSAAALRRLTGAPLAIHRADAAALARGETALGTARGRGRLLPPLMPLLERLLRPEPVVADVLLKDGDSLEAYGLDAVVVHTPGHTPGSSCLIVEGRVGFMGDMVSHTGRPHWQRLYAVDWSLLEQSIARLCGLRLERAYPGHGLRPLDAAAWAGLTSGGRRWTHSA